VNWIDSKSVAQSGWGKATDPFPIWKMCIIVALLCLAGETYLLIRKKKTINAQEPSAAQVANT